MFQQETDNIHTLSHEDITMQLKQEVECANEEYGMHNFDEEVEELQVEIMPEHAPAPVSLTTISTPEKPLTIDKPSDKCVSVHKQRMFACKLCGLTFSRLYLIKRHLLAHVKNYTPQFQCTKCHHSYRRKESLLRHYRSCDGTTNLSCEFCNMAFKCVEKLTRHKSLRHSEAPAAIPSKTINEEDLNDENMSQYYDCFFESVERHVADKPVRLKKVKEKLKPDNSKLFGCKLCTFTGKRFADVKSHLFLHLKTRPFACDKCNRSFGRGDKLKRHMKTCNGKIVLSCDICNNAFQTAEKLAEHAKVHEGKSLKKTYALAKTLELKDLEPSNLHQYCTTVAENIPDNDESGTESDASVKRIKNEESEQFVCPICYESFEQITLLEWHGRQYHENCQVLRCNQCDARFSRVYALNQHMQFHNIDADAIKVKDHECEKCLSRFKTRQSMLAHKKKHHGDENFACLKCAETFLTKDKLVEHLKMHEKSKFICSECGSSFLRNEYLIIHIKKHRGEKPYTCKFCNEGFARVSDLTVHERVHTGDKAHLCLICNHTFSRADSLTVHMRTHTGEKRFKCHFCDSAFAHQHALKNHLSRHTGIGFQCDLCPLNFIKGIKLIQHKRKVHGLSDVKHSTTPSETVALQEGELTSSVKEEESEIAYGY